MQQTLAVAFSLLALVAYTSAQDFKCYQCNSAEKGQEECNDSDNLPAKYVKPCKPLTEGTFKGKKAIACRKIIQNVGDDQLTVRECAYSGEDVDGMRKTGNWGISVFYYQCSNEDQSKPCNGVSAIGALFSTGLLALVALIYA